MQLLIYISDVIIPMLILGIVYYGMSKKVPVYETFVTGAKKGFSTVIKIMPTLIALMVAVGILRASGFLEMISEVIGKFTSYIGFPWGTGSSYDCENVFLFCSDRTSFRYL